MNIKITADSTCDLSEALLRQWNISLIPMHILMGEESYLDGVTIHPADVFAHAQNGGKMPKSAAPNLVEYTDFLAPFAKDYDAVIHINVGSKFSSCFQNARLAAQEFGNVYVVDSENICTGQGYLVLQAAKWAADGLPPKNISMRLQGLAKRVELSFVLNQLDYMAKSGRCSGVLAFASLSRTEIRMDDEVDVGFSCDTRHQVSSDEATLHCESSILVLTGMDTYDAPCSKSCCRCCSSMLNTGVPPKLPSSSLQAAKTKAVQMMQIDKKMILFIGVKLK